MYFFFVISRSFILRMRNVSDKSCIENQNIHLVLSIFFFGNHAVYDVMWENIVERGSQQMRLWCNRIACWMPKTANT